MKIFNCTNHTQNATALQALGFPLVGGTEGHGFLVGTDEDFDDVRRKAQGVVEAAKEAGADALLLGGLTSATVALADIGRAAGLDLCECITVRERDENDRFVFNLRGVRVLR